MSLTSLSLDQDRFEFITIKVGENETVWRIADFERIEIKSEYPNFATSWIYYGVHRRGRPDITITLRIDYERFIQFEGVDSYTLTEFKGKTRHEKLAALVRKHYQN